MERTLILVKPDAVQRGLIGEVLGRLERRGLRLVALRLMQADEALARRHYAEHEGKPFFAGLVDYITSSPLVAAVFEGPGRGRRCAPDAGLDEPRRGRARHDPRRLRPRGGSQPGAWIGRPGERRERDRALLRRRGGALVGARHGPLDLRVGRSQDGSSRDHADAAVTVGWLLVLAASRVAPRSRGCPASPPTRSRIRRAG